MEIIRNIVGFIVNLFIYAFMIVILLSFIAFNVQYIKSEYKEIFKKS